MWIFRFPPVEDTPTTVFYVTMQFTLLLGERLSFMGRVDTPVGPVESTFESLQPFPPLFMASGEDKSTSLLKYSFKIFLLIISYQIFLIEILF